MIVKVQHTDLKSVACGSGLIWRSHNYLSNSGIRTVLCSAVECLIRNAADIITFLLSDIMQYLPLSKPLAPQVFLPSPP